MEAPFSNSSPPQFPSPPLKKTKHSPPLVNPAFITGSQAYGTPTEESDVDLVILVDPKTLRFLMGAFGDIKEDDESYKDMTSAQFSIGTLNLILCQEVKHYRQWQRGTKTLKAMAPVTREQAVALFASIREEGNE